MQNCVCKSFTLIELLIVVAIIAILAAIAVPNFLEAQTRSKSSRIRADQRSIATALEAYNVDTQHYPPEADPAGNWSAVARYVLVRLTTPVAYLTSTDAARDIFHANIQSYASSDPNAPKFDHHSMFYRNFEAMARNFRNEGGDLLFTAYILSSFGPDRADSGITYVPYMDKKGFAEWNTDICIDRIYDPTNGTVSFGDIGRVGGSAPGWTSSHIR